MKREYVLVIMVSARGADVKPGTSAEGIRHNSLLPWCVLGSGWASQSTPPHPLQPACTRSFDDPHGDGGLFTVHKKIADRAAWSSRFLSFFFNRHFLLSSLTRTMVGGFTLSDLVDKPWSQVSSVLPPGTCLHVLSRIGFSIPTARRSSSNVANSRSRAFR